MNLSPLQFADRIRLESGTKVDVSSRREVLQALALIFGRFLTEDPTDGSEFDHRVLESLTDLANRYKEPNSERPS